MNGYNSHILWLSFIDFVFLSAIYLTFGRKYQRLSLKLESYHQCTVHITVLQYQFICGLIPEIHETN